MVPPGSPDNSAHMSLSPVLQSNLENQSQGAFLQDLIEAPKQEFVVVLASVHIHTTKKRTDTFSASKSSHSFIIHIFHLLHSTFILHLVSQGQALSTFTIFLVPH